MSKQRLSLKDPRVQAALEELKGMILQRYPTATFAVARGPEDPREIDLITTVDVEDAFELLDVVMDRLLQLQIEEGLPIHVIPERPLERVVEEMRRSHPYWPHGWDSTAPSQP